MWTVDSNTTVVGGTQNLNQWTPGQPPSLPGACRAPSDPFATDGVQFVFGGDSRMQVGSTRESRVVRRETRAASPGSRSRSTG